MNTDLIYGKDSTQGIVSIECKDDIAEIFIQQSDGSIKSEFTSNRYWILAPYQLEKDWMHLDGNLHYCWGKQYKKRSSFERARMHFSHEDIFSVYDPKESHMINYGRTYFKGLKPKDISILSFDTETTTLEHNDDSRLLLISNTFRKGEEITRKLFAFDEYNDEGEMIEAWCKWVREVNPSILCAHNGFGFDLPYLRFIAEKFGVQLNLGRDGSPVVFDRYVSKKRKDQTQDYHYHKAYIYGREFIDTLFLSINYDMASKKYESYGLKSIIATEGLEKPNRTFYEASKIRFKYKDPEEWKKIKEYCKDDSDDALALFDLMSPSYFYMTQSIPKSFQNVICTASGSQINSIMLRAYIQQKHSIPQASAPVEYEGAISLGNPGRYSNVWKVDVSSLYPSIMIQYEVYNPKKDPKGLFKELVSVFTTERLKNKRLAKDTGDKYFDDLQNSQKIAINSMYGFLGTKGLIFNSPEHASFITKTGRDILNKSMEWASSNRFVLINADTDSISICKKDQTEIPVEERLGLLKDLNSLFPPKIRFEDDGYFKSAIIFKTKNYVLQTPDGKIKIKGSAIKASTKEPALKEFIQVMVTRLLNGETDHLVPYNNLVKEILELKDIKRWATRKSLTSKTYKSERANETKILDAVKGTEYVEGDRIYLYFKSDDTLSLIENFDGDYSKTQLLRKLHDTVKVFDTVIDTSVFPNYALKRNKILLDNFSKTL